MKTQASLRITRPDKVMYPQTGFTKRDVAEYYLSVSSVVLPHLRGRPMTLKRYPNGVEGPFFYEKRCPAYRPRWVHTARVNSAHFPEGVHHCVVDDEATLMWMVNLASLELHTLLSTQPHVDRPTQLMFDLDPGAPAGLEECARVAIELKKLFDSLKLRSFIKTSGGKGLHFAVPLNVPITYDVTKRFAHAVAVFLERAMPRLVVSKMSKALRPGKVLVDWSQNDNHKTTIAPYSLRARPFPTVSTPLTWEEIHGFLRTKRKNGLIFEAKQIMPRVERVGDLYAPMTTLRQRLPLQSGMLKAIL